MAERPRFHPAPTADGLPGFDPPYADLVDYIVRITERIWERSDMGHIHDTYAPDVIVHTGLGTERGIEGVIAGSVHTLAAFPDRRMAAEDVIATHDGAGTYRSGHLIANTATHDGPGRFGPPTGRSVRFHAIAECVVRANHIVEEWLVRDTRAVAEQLGFDPLDLAAHAEVPATFDPTPPGAAHATDPVVAGADADDPAVRTALDLLEGTINGRHFNRIAELYDDATVTWVPGHVELHGPDPFRRYALTLVAPFPDAYLDVQRVDVNAHEGLTRVAVRWSLRGTHRLEGRFGPPTGRPIDALGISHVHVQDGRVVRHYVVLDELALLTTLHGTPAPQEARS
ncbi:MAG: ester cyclase [Trueperaceae bacterium]|nr:ester cyclase [Trueperaceae bacterium]